MQHRHCRCGKGSLVKADPLMQHYRCKYGISSTVNVDSFEADLLKQICRCGPFVDPSLWTLCRSGRACKLGLELADQVLPPTLPKLCWSGPSTSTNKHWDNELQQKSLTSAKITITTELRANCYKNETMSCNKTQTGILAKLRWALRQQTGRFSPLALQLSTVLLPTLSNDL